MLPSMLGDETLTMVESSVSSSAASITATTMSRRRSPYSTRGRPSGTVAAEYSTRLPPELRSVN